MSTPIFAKEHTGFRANGLRYLRENIRGAKFMREEMARHLEEMAQRYYAGDIAVVDEFLQLYCIGEHERVGAIQREERSK